jgi:hypothetical protein
MTLAEIKDRIERLQRSAKALHDELLYIASALSAAPDKADYSPVVLSDEDGTYYPPGVSGPVGAVFTLSSPALAGVEDRALPPQGYRYEFKYEFNRQICKVQGGVTQHARKAGSRDEWLCVKCHAAPAPAPAPEPAHEPAQGTRRSSGPKYEFKGLDCPVHGQAPHCRERHTLGDWLCVVCHPT